MRHDFSRKLTRAIVLTGGPRSWGAAPFRGEAGGCYQGVRQRVAVSVLIDGTTRWSNVCELQDKVRDAEDALERAKADAARAHREARIRSTMDAIEHAQGPVAFPLDRAGRVEAAKEAV